MNGEILQFLIVGGVVLAVIASWLIFVYRPRRTGEDDGTTGEENPRDRDQ